MMKHLLFQHRMLSSFILAIFFMAGSVHAQEAPANTEEPPQTEDRGISTPRRVAGLGVLAFLIGWMIWRSSSGRQKDGGQNRELSRK